METIIIDEVQALKNKKRAKKNGCRILDMAKYEKRRKEYLLLSTLIKLVFYAIFFGMGILYGLESAGCL